MLALYKTQTASSKIWTRVAVSIFYDDNHYIMYLDAAEAKMTTMKMMAMDNKLWNLISRDWAYFFFFFSCFILNYRWKYCCEKLKYFFDKLILKGR